jgi:translation elongation factor EF-G
MTYLPVESFIIQRLQEGGWRVIHRQTDLTDVPIADFVSHREADEWVKWKSGHPKINPYAIADEVSTQPRLEIAIGPKSRCDASFPVVDVKVTLIDGAYHDVDSSALAFEIAASAAFREVLHKAGSVVLEPIMKVEVVGPADCIASVTSDLNLRRGQIQGQNMRGNATVINAMVPLVNMFGYVNNLRSMSRGRATFTMRFDHYAVTPTPSSTN